jgi:hypothetical protein
MNEPSSFDAFDHESKIEAMVHAARFYVEPSEDLRPRVLEAAREHCADQRAERRLGGFALAVLLLALIASPLGSYVALLRSSAVPRSASEVQRHATELAGRREIGSHWALAEAFSHWRHLQAARLGHSQPGMK